MLRQAAIGLCCISIAAAASTAVDESRTSALDLMHAFIGRASRTSEVLTLNLTNLIILVILKAIILAFGLFGGGAWGRSDNQVYSYLSGIVPDSRDASLVLSMSLAEKTDEFGCFYRIACEDADRTHDYVTGAKMVLKAAKTFKRFLPVNSKYDNIITGLDDAIEVNDTGRNCKEIYRCSALDR